MTRGMGDSDDGFVRVDTAGEIAYQVRGRHNEGTPILLVRPLGGSMKLWGSFRVRLAEKHRVIAYDLRGTGHSGRDHGWVTTRAMARDAIRLLDHLEVPRANVFGISLGGMAATWLAADAPSRVEKLCISSAPLRGLELTRNGLGRELAMAACLARRREDVEAALVHRVFSDRFLEERPEEVKRIEATIRAEPSTRLALVRHAMAGVLHDGREAVSKIQAPTLVLAGANDGLLGTEPPRHLASSIQGACFEIMQSSGHDLTLERPIETAERVVRFFTESAHLGDAARASQPR